MTYQDQLEVMEEDKAVSHLKELINDYDFNTGNSHVIKLINLHKRYIELLFIFGRNITARFDYQMGAWIELKSRFGDIHRFYWKDEKTKNWMDEEIRTATTCFCGQKDFRRSDGYPQMENCPYGKRDFRCKTIKVNVFSQLVPNCTR